MPSVIPLESTGGGTVESGTGAVESIGEAAVESVGEAGKESAALGTALESAGKAASADGPTPSVLHAVPRMARRRPPAMTRRRALRNGVIVEPSISVASP